jgi:hypothetical protein
MILVAVVLYVVYGWQAREAAPATALTDEEVVARAQGLGMIFYADLPKTAAPTAAPAPTATVPPEISEAEVIRRAQGLGMAFVEAPPAQTPVPTATPPVVVNIPQGIGSFEIAEMLQAQGVIEDAAAFNQYVEERQATKLLPFGAFTFPAGLTYEEVYDVLRRR